MLTMTFSIWWHNDKCCNYPFKRTDCVKSGRPLFV